MYNTVMTPTVRRGVANTPILVAIAFGCCALVVCFSWTDMTARPSFTEPMSYYRGGLPDVERLKEPISPIPSSIVLDQKIVELGRQLFHEPRLSSTGEVSCASCHDLELGGVDRRPASVGIAARVGSVNAPTVFNSGLNFAQFWDGRSETLEQQVDGPLTSRLEMGGNWPATIKFLNTDSGYDSQFRESFGQGATPETVRKAIADFERSLLTPGSRFDQWLCGDTEAISEQEKRGYQLFKDYRCVTCHQGVNVGGNSFQRLGVMIEYFSADRIKSSADAGRFNVTGNELDRHVFRVPPLRNVELTPPYFHDGSCETLEDAVRVMIRYQLGRRIVDKDVSDIVAFLKTLTGTPMKGNEQ